MELFQGGVNFFKDGFKSGQEERDKNEFQFWAQQMPAGMFGWNGYGGSVHVWDNEMEIGFAYVPTYLAWYDRERKKAIRCLRKLYECFKDK